MTFPIRVVVHAAVAVASFTIAFAQAPPAIVIPVPGGPAVASPPWLAELTERQVSARFDSDKNGWLNADERKTARETLRREAASRPPSPRPGPRAGGPPVGPGPRMLPAGARAYPGAGAFDPAAVRTYFLEFEEADWEKALEEFRFTDIQLPARLTVDGQVFTNVGVRFRGASSFLFVPEGRKRSLNLSLDFVNGDQRFAGYRNFNLLNSNGDPTMLRALLYYEAARAYTPAPKAAFSKVVINGEYWGVYVNVQQTDRDFVNEWWKTTGGSRWKAPGSPWGQAGLAYIGPNVDDYRKIYEIQSRDNQKSWAALINLTRVLTETPLDRLEGALAPIFDIDSALKFLALESAFINDDGYWIRASDYNLYLDERGRFHIYPHDGNETFFDLPPGMRGNAPKSTALDPFIGSDEPRKVLLNRLLAVPSLRTRYLGYLKDIATNWLDWRRLGPIALKYQALVDADVRADTRKLETYEAFRTLVERDMKTGNATIMGLKTFADERRAFLLNYPAIKALP